MAYRLPRIVFLAVALLLPGRTWAQSPQHLAKLDLALRAALSSDEATHRVIVRVKPGSQSKLRDALKRHGDRVHGDHGFIRAVSAEVHREDLETLAGDPNVESISSDAVVQANAVLSYESTGSARALHDTLGLSGTSLTGNGVVVALLDSGAAREFDSNNRVIEYRDFTNGGRLWHFPWDDFGHGSHVAGLIGGPSSEQLGLAPGVRFVVLKVLDSQGRGYTSNVISAIDYIIQNQGILGVDIINLSLGHRIYESGETDPLVQAVERASRAGIIVVVAAGNAGTNRSTGITGYSGILSPGNAPSAITVGAIDTKHTASRSDDEITRYSSRGPSWYDGYAKPDIVAPGHRLVSNATTSGTLYASYPEWRVDSQYFMLSGTSMSTAVTTAVVALMLEAQRDNLVCDTDALCGCTTPPPLTPNAVKALLQYSALPIKDSFGAAFNGLIQGAGALNALGAIALADSVNTSLGAGLPWLTVGVLPYTTIAGETIGWAQNITWGVNIVWGGGLIDTNQAAWATNIVWGNSTNIVWGNSANIVWGGNIVWSITDDIVWGNNIVWGNQLIGTKDASGNVTWGSSTGDNIVWGNLTADNIVWGNLSDPDIVWGTDDNVVWGNSDGANIVWGARRGGRR